MIVVLVLDLEIIGQLNLPAISVENVISKGGIHLPG